MTETPQKLGGQNPTWKQEQPSRYILLLGLWKGAKAGAYTLWGLVGWSVVDVIAQAFASEANTALVLGGFTKDHPWMALAIPVISGAARTYWNRRQVKKELAKAA